jgi:hypothetical protein
LKQPSESASAKMQGLSMASILYEEHLRLHSEVSDRVEVVAEHGAMAWVDVGDSLLYTPLHHVYSSGYLVGLLTGTANSYIVKKSVLTQEIDLDMLQGRLQNVFPEPESLWYASTDATTLLSLRALTDEEALATWEAMKSFY